MNTAQKGTESRPGYFSICRDNHNQIQFSLYDETAQRYILRGVITPEAFGKAVVGFADQPIVFAEFPREEE